MTNDLSKVSTDELRRRRASTTRRIERYRAMGNEALERIVIDERTDLDAELARRVRAAKTRTCPVDDETTWPDERAKGDDDGREYGHPGDFLKGLE